MRIVAACLAVLGCATPVFSQSELSAEIGKNGITATLSRLEAQPQKTPAETFALGGLHFLATVERVLQWEWRTGPQIASMVLQIGIIDPRQVNPEPEAITGANLAQLAADIDTGLQDTLTALETLPKDADFELQISLADLWFDLNQNNRRDEGEDGAMLGRHIMGWNWHERDPKADVAVIRFDSADAAWLSAYSHRFSALVNVVLAYDPFSAIDDVIATRAALNALGFDGLEHVDDMFPYMVDAAFVAEQTLRQTPDAQRMAAVKSSLLNMITEYRRFWAMVDAEQDDDREWMPNIHQTSAFGLKLPPQTPDGWLTVLTDAEALLNGDLLVPFWRGSKDQGIDISPFFTTPQPIDLMRWVQGADAVPHLKKGEIVSPQTAFRILEIVLGNSEQMMAFDQ